MRASPTSRPARCVVVRVNDRGPFLHGRLIDLSYAAAQQARHRAKGQRRGGASRRSCPGATSQAAASPPLPPVARAARVDRASLPMRPRRSRDPAPSGTPAVSPCSWAHLQILQMRRNSLAHVQNQLATAQVEAKVRQVGGLFRVYVGPYPERGEARRVGERLTARVRIRDDGRAALTSRTRAVATLTRFRARLRYNFDGVPHCSAPSHNVPPRAESLTNNPIPALDARLLRLPRRCSSPFSFLPLAAARSADDRDRRRRRRRRSRSRSFRSTTRATYPLGITGIVGADLSRSGLFQLVDPSGVVAAAGARRGRAAGGLARAQRRCGRRRVDAAVGRRPRRRPFRAGRRRQADARSPSMSYTRHAGAVPRDRAQDRRRDLREADRRRRVCSRRASRTSPSRAPRYPAAGRRCRRRRSADGRHVERAAAVADVVARRHAARLRVVREQEARRLRADRCRPASGRRSPISAAATARRRGRPTAAGSRSR